MVLKRLVQALIGACLLLQQDLLGQHLLLHLLLLECLQGLVLQRADQGRQALTSGPTLLTSMQHSKTMCETYQPEPAGHLLHLLCVCEATSVSLSRRAA